MQSKEGLKIAQRRTWGSLTKGSKQPKEWLKVAQIRARGSLKKGSRYPKEGLEVAKRIMHGNIIGIHGTCMFDLVAKWLELCNPNYHALQGVKINDCL